VLTQTLTTGTPNLARGIGLVPVLYLYVALALRRLERLAPGRRGRVRTLLLALAVWTAGASAVHYVRWARSAEFAASVHPSIAVGEFEEWWTFQNEGTRENDSFFDVRMWLERKRAARSP
jgi:hypothetical protein